MCNEHTSVGATRTTERVSKVAVSATAGRLRCSRDGSQETCLLILYDLDGLPTLSAIKHDDLVLRELLRLKLGETARAVLACFLPPRRSVVEWLTRRNGSLTVLLCEE